MKDSSLPYHIDVEAEAQYLDDQSHPESKRYVFAYTVTIRNYGTVAAQLISRHWVITDADGKTQEVHGEGVVGEQPYLNPGEGFQYTSASMIETPVGTMHGTYQMRAEDGTEFEADIAPFRLALERTLH